MRRWRRVVLFSLFIILFPRFDGLEALGIFEDEAGESAAVEGIKKGKYIRQRRIYFDP
jgi:hypothetical protein